MLLLVVIVMVWVCGLVRLLVVCVLGDLIFMFCIEVVVRMMKVISSM